MLGMAKWVVLLLLFPLLLAGAETKKVTYQYLYPQMKEIFYVLKSDTTVRHGPYQLLSNGKPLVLGSYNMGKKDSLWTQYNQKGVLRCRGSYENDKREGIWEYYDNNAQLEQKIDFTKNEVIAYRTSFSKHPFRVISGTDTTLTVLDRPPLFLGGSNRLNEYIAGNLGTPLHKKGENVSGTVYVTFTIDSLGKPSNYQILKGVSNSCNREALRVVEQLPDDWLPGVLNGRNVTVDYVLPIVFSEKNTPVRAGKPH